MFFRLVVVKLGNKELGGNSFVGCFNWLFEVGMVVCM